MAVERESITVENCESKIEEYLEKAPVGSVEFIAFCNAIEWRGATCQVREYRRVLELMGSRAGRSKLAGGEYGSRSEVESELRIAETRLALARREDIRLESTTPGYGSLEIYCQEMVVKVEQQLIQEDEYHLPDQELKEIRERYAAYEYLRETISPLIMADAKATGQAVMGLIRSVE